MVANNDTTASVASSSEMSFADSTTASKLLPKKEGKKEKPTGGVKLKKSIAKKTKPKDTESNGIKFTQCPLCQSGANLCRCRDEHCRRDS